MTCISSHLIDAKVGVRPVRERHRPARSRNLLHGDDVREVAQVAPAVVGVRRDPQEAHVAELSPELPQLSERETGTALVRPVFSGPFSRSPKIVLLVDGVGVRGQLFLTELKHRLPERPEKETPMVQSLQTADCRFPAARHLWSSERPKTLSSTG